MDNQLALLELLAIHHRTNLMDGLWWNCSGVVQTRHQMYREGLIKQDRRSGVYEVTEKGLAWIEAAAATPLPVQQEVVTTQWVVPKAA